MTIFAAPLFLQDPRTVTAFVDAAPVRQHLAKLSEVGIGYRRAAELAGLSVEVTRNLAYGRRGVLPTRIARDRAERLLALEMATTARSLIPATGARRRLQALIHNGWSQKRIAAQLGLSSNNFGRILEQDTVRTVTHYAIVDLFDVIWDVKPPMVTTAEKLAASRSREFARRRGWLPALAWDDIDRDEQPAPCGGEVDFDEVAIDLACEGHPVQLNNLERKSAIRVLNGRHLSDGEIAAVLGMDGTSVCRARRRLRIPAALGADGQLLATA